MNNKDLEKLNKFFCAENIEILEEYLDCCKETFNISESRVVELTKECVFKSSATLDLLWNTLLRHYNQKWKNEKDFINFLNLVGELKAHGYNYPDRYMYKLKPHYEKLKEAGIKGAKAGELLRKEFDKISEEI